MIEQYKNKNRILKFFLSNPSEGVIELYHAPDGWDKSGYSYSRSEFYHGVVRKYALSKLGFPKEGRAFLEKIEEEQGFEAEVSLIIWEFDFSTYSYFVLFQGNVQLVDKDADRLKITVPIVDSSFESKLLNRDDVPIITTKRTDTENYTSIDNKQILGFSNESQLLTLPERIDFLSSLMTSDRTNSYFTNVDGDPIIPLLLKSDSDDDNVQGNTNDYRQSSGAFYTNATGADATIEMEGSVDFKVLINPLFTSVSNIKVSLFIIDNTNTVVETIDLSITKTLLTTGFNSETYGITGDISINKTIAENNYMQLGVMENNFFGTLDTGAIIDFSIVTQGDFTPKVNIQTVLIHEAFARIGQKLTSENNPFYSELFGRMNSEPRAYTYDGEDSFLAVTNGALLRGFPMTNRATSVETTAPLSISLKDLFSACSVKRPLGMGIETINGDKVFRIEDLKYFFDTRIALTIDNATDIKKEYNKDLINNEFEAGYTKFEPDEIINGLFDYNTKSKWANAIQTVKDKLSVISKYSASNASINQARSKELNRQAKPTTDSKYDDINFMIDIVENQTGNSVLNPNADNGLSDWSVTSGVSTQTLIGNPKFILDFISNAVLVRMTQQLTAISTPVMSFSYTMISSEELTFTPTVRLIATLNDATTRNLDSNGDWAEEDVNIFLPSIKGVQESQFQAMNKFEISANGVLDDINYLTLEFTSAFIGEQSGTNKYIIDDVYLSDSARYKARTTEDFDSIAGIVNSNDSYNIALSPARTLRRWGYVLRAFLDKKPNTFYSFTDTEKNSTLVSKLTTESFSVSEGQDVLVNDLDEPIWGVEKISFNALLTAAQRKDINLTFNDSKPKVLGLVKYRRNTNEAYSHGWIDDLNLGGMDGIADLEVRPISKYVVVSEPIVAVDDDLVEFTDDDLTEFIIE